MHRQEVPHFPLLLLLLPAWLALFAYLPTVAHGYVWDDTYFLQDLPYLRDPALWWQAVQQPLFVSINYFRPLPLLMFVVEARLGGPGAFVFHAVNVLMHAGNTLLVVLLARGLLPVTIRNRYLAAGAGCLFALHPALIESVCWISDRFDLAMTSFVLIALLAEQRVHNACVRRVVLSLSFLAALLSKETAVLLLVLLPPWQLFLQAQRGGDLHDVRAWWRDQRALYLLLALMLLAYLVLRFGALGFLYRGDSQMVAGGVLAHLLLIGKTIGGYLHLLVLPFGQIGPVHPATTPIAFNDTSAWVGSALALLCGIGAVAVVRRKQYRFVPFCMALLALLPVANFLPLTIGDNIVHDRYLMLPVAFTALGLACVLSATQPWLRYCVCAWLLAALASVVMVVPHWENNLSLWAWAYQQYPQSQIAGGNYVLALAEAQRNTEAVQLAHLLLAEGPSAPQAAMLHHALALALFRQGDFVQAEREIKLRLDEPRRDDAAGRYAVSEAINLLASIQMRQGRYDAARANLNEAVRLTPYLPRPHYNLALLHYAHGDVAAGDAELALTLRYASGVQAALFRRAALQARMQPGLAE